MICQADSCRSGAAQESKPRVSALARPAYRCSSWLPRAPGAGGGGALTSCSSAHTPKLCWMTLHCLESECRTGAAGLPCRRAASRVPAFLCLCASALRCCSPSALCFAPSWPRPKLSNEALSATSSASTPGWSCGR